MIPFNKPYFTGQETDYIKDAVVRGHISGNGYYTKLCQDFIEKRYGIKKALMTTSCSDALEMAALLLDLLPEDEVIMPSYTFVSTANAFVIRGAKIVFADVQKNHPNIDVHEIEKKITPKTKAIVIVHYGGVACNMDEIVELCNQHQLILIEDAAQAIESTYKNKPLGTFGHLATLSFHETKNIISGEGGMLLINDKRFIERAEILWEKGTNRNAFFRGEVDKYNWVDIGSSFLPSDVISAFLWAQFEKIEEIQLQRKKLWNRYYSKLSDYFTKEQLPPTIENTGHNGHIFYFITHSIDERTQLINYLKSKNINSVFHYISLHLSPFYLKNNPVQSLENTEKFSNTLVRLPMFYELSFDQIDSISNEIINFYKNILN